MSMATKLGGDIQWEVVFYKVTRSFNLHVLQSHVKYFNCYITTTTRPMANKPGKVVTYSSTHKVIQFFEHMVTWGHVTD